MSKRIRQYDSERRYMKRKREYLKGYGYHMVNTHDREMAAKLMAEIPPDNRDLTATLMGDPRRGRRAIDRRAP